MEGERRQEKTWPLMGLNNTAGDKTRRRSRKKKLLHCHSFGESHRRRQNSSRGEDKWDLYRPDRFLTSCIRPLGTLQDRRGDERNGGEGGKKDGMTRKTRRRRKWNSKRRQKRYNRHEWRMEVDRGTSENESRRRWREMSWKRKKIKRRKRK